MATAESIDDGFMIRKHVSQDQKGRAPDVKQEDVACTAYDDISSDAVDVEEPLDVVTCEQEHTADDNTGGQRLGDGIAAGACKNNEESRDGCREFSENKNSDGLGEGDVDVVAEDPESGGEDGTKHVNDRANCLDADQSAEVDSGRKSAETIQEHSVHEPKFVPARVREFGGRPCKGSPMPMCDYRTGFKHSLYGRNSPLERCSPPNFSSDSDTDLSNLKTHNQKLIKSLLSSEGDLMKFAEILYKCTLCTSIPSILTSKSSFLKHVKEQHFTNDSCLKRCEFCSLKFRTEEDLKEHVNYLHQETSQIPENLSSDQTGGDVIVKSHDSVDNENDSDSDSSGHRNYKAKLVKKVKPVLDFENPKQLVDHTGIQTLDGSLDLSKKDSSSKVEHKEHTVSVKAEQKSAKNTQEPNMVHVQQITDQIMKSNFQGRNPSTPNGPLSFTPSFTPEFGKYTKLVREGGNIVYFCQVCNWKSPIKATFHGHCGTATHKSKVLQTEDPDSADSSSVVSDRNPSSRSSPNISVSAASEPKPRDSSYWSGQNRPYGPKTTEAGLYGQFVPPRGVSYNGRPQVASPFKNGNSSERNNPYKRSSESSSETAHKGSKKFSLSSSSAKKAKSHGGSSDSDSDDGNNNNSKISEHLFPWNKAPLDMPTLYQNYPLLPFCTPPRFSYDRLFSSTLGANKPSKPETDFTGNSKNESQLFSFSSHKRQTETSPVEEDAPNKRSKGDAADNTETPAKDAKEKVEAIFKLYKCHACPFEYSDIEEYEKHFDEVHKAPSQAEAGARGGVMEKQAGRMPTDLMGGDFETGENFRVQKLKEILSGE